MNTIILFKNSLRINDNPMLYNGSLNCKILPVYILDEINISKKLGSASKYWLHHSLFSLNSSLDFKMQFYKGDTLKILEDLVQVYTITKICCEEYFIEDDIRLFKKIKKKFKAKNVEIFSYNSTLLWKPYHILKSDNSPYKVFSPFYKRGCLNGPYPNPPIGRPKNIQFISNIIKTNINDLNLLDSRFNWYRKFDGIWNISEDAALSIFKDFLDKSIFNYKNGRDFPSLSSNSKLSPYLRFGMISVNRIWYELIDLEYNENIEHFKSEIGWREFSYYLLYHFPYMSNNNFKEKFDYFEWENSKDKFESWKRGQTGYPIIDAGMKELWNTGYMHNRIRMVVASFLVKNLLVDWRLGEHWFWDCLFDADYASNVASWQWVAGSGADAAPYFRIFNPILQGEKFDSNGKYTLKYVPALAKVPLKFIQKPWQYSDNLSYCKPIVDYKESRELALFKYSLLKNIKN